MTLSNFHVKKHIWVDYIPDIKKKKQLKFAYQIHDINVFFIYFIFTFFEKKIFFFILYTWPIYTFFCSFFFYFVIYFLMFFFFTLYIF